jgi:two-component system, chemotaxis family, protein-glutamate methylesterase/glutaminase
MDIPDAAGEGKPARGRHRSEDPANVPGFDIVALASSAGGFRALTEVLAPLPEGFPVPLMIVQHLDRRHSSLIAQILSRRTRLGVVEAENGATVKPGCVYVAPPDRHLLVNGDRTISLTQTELVHFVRPSADLLFESVAAAFGDRAIAVVLTGMGKDGSMGINAIKKMGGTVIAQDEGTSEFFGMPAAAIQTGSVDFVLPLEDISSALISLVMDEPDHGRRDH